MPQVDYDVIIVGGGLAGSALAITLAPAGLKLLVVEQHTMFRDRIRGEFLMPWGTREAQQLGIGDLLMQSCATEIAYMTQFVGGAPAVLRDLTMTTPGNSCFMTFPHPQMQQVLLDHAHSLGIEVRRGETVSGFLEGCPPQVCLSREDKPLSARLIVLADGRDSRLRADLGFDIKTDPEILITAGMLLEGDVDCSEALTEGVRSGSGTINLFYDPEGSRMALAARTAPGRNRIYLIHHKEALSRRLSGLRSAEEMIGHLQAVGAPPHWFERARPTGPLASFNGAHRYVEHPGRNGVVLLGDAAAASDPAWGQGLSRTLRDVRLLRDRLLQTDNWQAAVSGYVQDHNQFYGCMRRLEAMETALLFERGEAADRRRQHAFSLFHEDPSRNLDTIGLGPDAPSDEHARKRYFGEI